MKNCIQTLRGTVYFNEIFIFVVFIVFGFILLFTIRSSKILKKNNLLTVV